MTPEQIADYERLVAEIKRLEGKRCDCLGTFGTCPVCDPDFQGDPEDEGGPDRLYLGIDGTMGDAQDVNHPFVRSVYGAWCRVCGLAQSYRRHNDG